MDTKCRELLRTRSQAQDTRQVTNPLLDDREADALLAKGDRASARVSSVRQAVREDAAQVRERVNQRVAQARDGIREEPMRTTLYALGLGVLIGMLLRR